MNGSQINVSSMNYGELDNLARTIEVRGERIYDSLNNIKNIFMEMRDAGFAGTTLNAVIDTLDRIGGLPEDVRRTCEDFKRMVDGAIAEVTDAESKILRTLEELINSDPIVYEFPEWYTMPTGDGVNLSADDIV